MLSNHHPDCLGGRFGGHRPDDYKLPFIARSDVMELKNIQNTRYSVADLKGILDRVLK
jgi:hypothetical protein